MTIIKTALNRRIWFGSIALALVAAVGGAIWLTSEPSSADANVAQTAATLDQALTADNDNPGNTDRARDLKAARGLEGQARLDAIKKVHADALAGKYGTKVEKRVEKRTDRRAAVFALLPDNLQADLTKLKAMPAGDDRTTFRKQIRKDALDGKYGDKVQKAAELLKKK
ncbi:MAG: hypothetical protein JWQ70_1125 [Aeromicrobium sp.]|nr:hypothetical protein [Aeromicrobium sp.]